MKPPLCAGAGGPAAVRAAGAVWVLIGAARLGLELRADDLLAMMRLKNVRNQFPKMADTECDWEKARVNHLAMYVNS
jgi:hypothetical protein